jgi:hypothetical protein
MEESIMLGIVIIASIIAFIASLIIVIPTIYEENKTNVLQRTINEYTEVLADKSELNK